MTFFPKLGTYPQNFALHWSFYMRIQYSRTFLWTYLPQITRSACTCNSLLFFNICQCLVITKFDRKSISVLLWLWLCTSSTKKTNTSSDRKKSTLSLWKLITIYPNKQIWPNKLIKLQLSNRDNTQFIWTKLMG